MTDAHSQAEIFDTVAATFRNVTRNDQPDLSLASTKDQVEGWDSLNHVHVVVELEKHFGIRFDANEIRTFDSIQKICDAIAARN